VSACYRHPKVEAPISCNLCQRPICTNCMISAPVGWQCPSCVKGAPPVRRMRDVQSGFAVNGQKPYVTYGLIAICVAMFAGQLGSPEVEDRFVVMASEVADGEWWRVVTSGFLHGNLIHLLFNMLLLFQLGGAVEARLGRARFLGIYALSLVGGSIGAMLLQDPNQPTLGASGAVYGLMGAVVALSRRGRSPIESGIGGLLVINLIFTFVFPGISIGGHLGGLAAGALAGLLIRAVGEGSDVRRVAATAAVLAVLTVGLVFASGPVSEWKVEAERSSPAARPAPNLGGRPA
jgi:membrane associated rhomboid family serine protease